MRKIICTAAVLAMLCSALAGCTKKDEASVSSEAPTTQAVTSVTTENETSETAAPEYHQEGFDYLALVNKTEPLPEGWEEALETVHMTNSVGDDVEVEKKAYDAYLELKAELEAEGIYVDLDSARRSIAEQQRIMDDFTEKYGIDYASKTVAEPGYSEHHTGLALDLYLIIDGKDVVLNEEMIQYPEIWSVIHSRLADHGFILRYPEDKEHITGYGYEPWHIRYIDDAEKAKEITSNGMTFEEYLGIATDGKPTVDYGSSELFSEDELKETAVQVKCSFAGSGRRVLNKLKYAGDEMNTADNLKLAKEYGRNEDYTQVIAFLADFTVTEESKSYDAGEYKDYPCWLARTEDDGWEIVTWGEMNE
ncbi:MAG: M15 family metallopeptidase [Ruminococcus sp.]|nr:M15 family metallopeptidase [Ruminococcus sp.]